MNLPKSYLSPSQIDLYLRCPFQYRLRYIDNVETDTISSALVFGRAMHRVFDRYLEGENDLRNLHNCFCKTFSNATDKEVQFSKRLPANKVFPRAEKMVRILLDNYEPHKVIAIEKEISGVIADIPILGIVDAITENGEKTIVEFKTVSSMRQRDYDLQVGTYSLISGIDHVEVVELSKTKNPAIQVREFNGLNFKKVTEDTYKQVAKAIENEIFYCQSSDGWKCDYCDYREICEYHNEKGK